MLKRYTKPLFILIIFGALGIHFFGSSIPYVNLSKIVLENLFLLMAFLVASTSSKKIQKIVFWLSLSLVIYTRTQSETWITPYLWGVLLFSPKLSAKVLQRKLQLLADNLINISKIAYKKHFWHSLALVTFVLILVFYHRSFSAYFEGDEWVFFRFYQPSVNKLTWFVDGFIQTFRSQKNLNVHMAPVANMLYVIEYRLFGLNFMPYIFVSLLTHCATSLSVGLFSYKLTKRKQVALLTTLIFALLATHSQAVTWVVASLYTQLVVLFGFLSFSFLLDYLEGKNNKKILLSSIFLLLAVWSKETSIQFLIAYPILYFLKTRTFKKSLKDFTAYGLVVIIFLLTQLPNLKAHTLPSEDVPTENNSSLVYKVSEKLIEYELDLKTFRFVAFGLKSLSQSFIPQEYIADVGVWLTQMQFPYFNQEKPIRGTNYLMFTQTAAPEFVSYSLSLFIILIWSLTRYSNKKDSVRTFSALFFLIGILPILAITLKFPWWGYSSTVDSRHLYHLTPVLVLIFVTELIIISKKLQKKYALPKHSGIIIVSCLLLAFQYQALTRRQKSQAEASSFLARKNIVKTLQKSIDPPPKKLLLYTTSNRSYYGFAELMLPFQTTFIHMIPVLFSDAYHPNGLQYPTSFFEKDFFPKGGLVTQGFLEEGEFAIGYFLTKTPVIKVLEKHDYPVDILYGFEFDGDKNDLLDITDNLRQEIKLLLDSRTLFKDWVRYGSIEEQVSFQVDPSWKVEKNENTYHVSSQRNPVFSLEVTDNSKTKETLSDFVGKQKIAGAQVETEYLTGVFTTDLDIDRVVLKPKVSDSTWFMAAGNNSRFIKLEVFDEEKTETAIRTFEFIDQPNEDISIERPEDTTK